MFLCDKYDQKTGKNIKDHLMQEFDLNKTVG